MHKIQKVRRFIEKLSHVLCTCLYLKRATRTVNLNTEQSYCKSFVILTRSTLCEQYIFVQ